MSNKEYLKDGVLFAAVTLQRLHNEPAMAADIIKSGGVENADCSHLHERDKSQLRVINRVTGMALRGLDHQPQVPIERVIGKDPEVVGSPFATTILAADHIGPVSLTSSRSSGKGQYKVLATFPTLKQAESAACYAVSPECGYANVRLIDGQDNPITHDSWDTWVFENSL